MRRRGDAHALPAVVADLRIAAGNCRHSGLKRHGEPQNHDVSIRHEESHLAVDNVEVIASHEVPRLRAPSRREVDHDLSAAILHLLRLVVELDDPGVVDELSPLARISGSPLMPRICIWHALNQRAIARRYARGIGKEYEDLNLIICHLGGGISVAAHDHGRAIDANNALDGEGPFSPERAGSLPAADLIRLCFSGKYSEKQLLKRIAGKAGLNAHLGTNNMREILQRIQQGDKHAELIVDAMIYHVAKNIAAEAAVLCGKVDAILLTGGMAHSDYLVSRLRQRIDFLAPVYTFPGEDEMEALALNALAVLQKKREAKVYQ